MHLHGHSFAVLGQEKLDDSLSLERVKEMESKKRPAASQPNQSTIQGHIYESIGWLHNCTLPRKQSGLLDALWPIDFHSESGMTMIFKVGKKSQIPPLPRDWQTCENYPWINLVFVSHIISHIWYFYLLLSIVLFYLVFHIFHILTWFFVIVK